MALYKADTEGKTFNCLYHKFYLLFVADTAWECQKWINSLKVVAESEEYNKNEDDLALITDDRAIHRYSKLDIYHKVTGKSVFKNYDVLMESYEQKVMLNVYIKSIVNLESQK